MRNAFSYCSSLKELPDISKWKTEKVNDMTGMFENCISLKKMPNIEKWNVSNVKKINSIFNNCTSLITLPNVDKWNINKIIKVNNMFARCVSSSLISSDSDLKGNSSSLEFNNKTNQNSSISSLSGEKNINYTNYYSKNFFNDYDDKINDYYEGFYS